MQSNKKAVSVIILTIMLLCAFVIGALLSYMWVLSSFYLEPENLTSLVITNADFSADHADYFYITVMNPSNSPSEANITEIYFTVEGNNSVFQVTDTNPALPIILETGTLKTIKCSRAWGDFAGSTITVHVSAVDASGAAISVGTSLVGLGLQVDFNATVSCKRFNVTIINDPLSAINLTLKNLYVNLEPITTDIRNVTISGINLPIGQSVLLQCAYDWEGLNNPTVQVNTLEGYSAKTTANAAASVLMLITNVTFNETNSNANEMSITVYNSNESSTAVNINDVTLAYINGSQSQEYHINGSNTAPSFAPYYTLGIGSTVTFDQCIWDWNNFRNQTVTISVNVMQGFTPASIVIETPSAFVLNMTELSFNLNDTSHFVAKIANMPVSLGNASIAMIRVNGTDVENFTSQIIPIGEPRIFNCTFDWRSFRGKNVSVTAELSDGEMISRNIMLPIVDLELLVNYSNSTEIIPYVNITVMNSIFSNKTVNITQIIFHIGNITNTIDGTLTNPTLVPNGYVLNIGSNVAIVCPWNWTLYSNQNLTITVQTVEGFSISQTLQIPVPTP
jgi:hypothetical protein